MPQRTESQLTTEIDVVRSETVPEGNTKERIAGIFDDLNVSKVEKVTGKGLSANDFTNTLKTKLDGITPGATANDTDTNLKNRANHTGTQTADTITNGTTNHVFTALNDAKLTGIAANATANISDATSAALMDTKDAAVLAGVNSSLATKADLVSGKIPTSQLPAITIGESFSVASQAAMLALTAQIGDVAVRTDQSNAKYLLVGTNATVLSNWINFSSTGNVSSVNGQTGAVVLGATDVGAAATLHTHAAADVTENSTKRFVSDAEKTGWNSKVDAAGALAAAPAETAGTVGGLVSGSANKATPIDADKLGFWDSVANTLKHLTFANLKTWLNTLYVQLTTFEADVLNILETVDVVTPAWLPVTANHTLTTANPRITVNPSGGAINITMPSLGAAAGVDFYIDIINNSNTVTLIGSIEGATNLAINVKKMLVLSADATTFRVLDAGVNGTNGTNGAGVPTGGTTGQVLAKIDATDFHTQWVTPSGGGGGGTDLSTFPVFKNRTSGTVFYPGGNFDFTKVPLSATPDIDSHSGWDAANNWWTVPAGQAGIYRITFKLRMPDDAAAGIGWGLGANTVTSEGDEFIWNSTTDQGKSFTRRNTITGSTIRALDAGDNIRLYYYIVYGDANLNLQAGALIIERIR